MSIKSASQGERQQTLFFFPWGKATIIFHFVCVKISNPAHKSDLSLDLSHPPLPHGDVLKIILRYEWQKGLHAWHFKLNADTTPVTWAAQAQTSSQPTISTTHHSETSLVTKRRHWDVKITVWDILWNTFTYMTSFWKLHKRISATNKQ